MQHTNQATPTKSSPTVPPPSPGGLVGALERNIEALVDRRRREQAQATIEERVAGTITAFTGSMLFVYIHLVLFGFWIIANVGWLPFIRPWDSSLVVLAMIASVEAIFLSTFVLISQNRMAAADDRRADLNLQISLLNEHETTKLITLVSAMAREMGIRTEVDTEVAELERDVAPEAVLDRIEATDEQTN